MWKTILTQEDLENIYIRITLWIESLLKISKDYQKVSYEGLRQAILKYEPTHKYIVVGNDLMFLETQEKVDITKIPELHRKIIMFTLSEKKVSESPMIFILF